MNTDRHGYEDDHFHDECGVFGVFGAPVEEFRGVLANALELAVRG